MPPKGPHNFPMDSRERFETSISLASCCSAACGIPRNLPAPSLPLQLITNPVNLPHAAPMDEVLEDVPVVTKPTMVKLADVHPHSVTFEVLLTFHDRASLRQSLDRESARWRSEAAARDPSRKNTSRRSEKSSLERPSRKNTSLRSSDRTLPQRGLPENVILL